MGDNADRLLKLLRNLQDVLRETVQTWKIANSRDEDAEELQKVVDITFECLILCTANLGKGEIPRFFSASIVQSRLESMEKQITMATSSISRYMLGQLYTRYVPYERQLTIELDENLQKVDSREKEKKNAMKFYDKEKANDGPVVLIIYGMGGAGKTVLASQIFYEFQRAKGNHCVRVELPFENDEKHLSRVQEGILRKLGANQFASTVFDVEDGRLKISKALKICRKPVFLYVDNINFEGHICKLLPQGKSFNKGSKILVTTRNRYIEGVMKEDPQMQHIKVIELKALKDEEAQSLLTNAILKGGISEHKLKMSSLAIKNVLKLCGGLPLALNSVAKCAIKLYRWYDEEDIIWTKIASSMERCEKLPCTTEDSLYESLKFSYEHFCSDEEKEAFLDIIFLTNSNVLDWKRMEMLVGVTNVQHLHNVALIEMEVEKKHDVYLVMGEERIFVRVHDVFRAIGEQMQKARKRGIYIMDDNELRKVGGVNDRPRRVVANDLLQRVVALGGVRIKAALIAEMPQVRYLFDVVIEGALEEPQMENAYNNLLALRTRGTFGDLLHMQRFPKVVDFEVDGNFGATDLKFLEGSTALRRLYLTSWHVLSNVDAIQKMTSLRHLEFMLCDEIQGLPEGISSLRRLTTFHLCHCPNIKILPEGLGCLKSLTELTLNSLGLSSLPEGVSGLTSLKVLLLEENEELNNLPNGLSCLTSLRRLSLRGCRKLSCLPEFITSMTCLQSLDLRGCSALENVPENVRYYLREKSFFVT